jgi:hypothetical protein
VSPGGRLSSFRDLPPDLLDDDTPTHWLFLGIEESLVYDSEARPVCIFPDTDVHKAFVLLRRDLPGSPGDDYFAVVCPACPTGDVSRHDDPGSALQSAFLHRLQNLAGVDLELLLRS